MTLTRRNLMISSMAVGAGLSIPSILRAQTASPAGQEVRMALGMLPTVFDPVFTTSGPTQIHGLAIYDTLFAPDSKGIAQPQMIGKWEVSDDKNTYTFGLREGLGWHDGTAVTAADCIASIRRWAQVAPAGKLLMDHTSDISKIDDKSFAIVLKKPFPLTIECLASMSGNPLFVMREQDAKLPATEQVTANIGSGPFKFNHSLARPGASFTYDRNKDYVPRQEPPDRYAGGKVVNIDRVVWNGISDQMTSLSALRAGEVDFLNEPAADFYSEIEKDEQLQLSVINNAGDNYFFRMNFLQKPFDNIKARQAMLHLIDQSEFLQFIAPDTRYRRTATSIFGSSSPYANEENTNWYKPGGDPERAKQLFAEAGYSGEKVVILDSTDWMPGDLSAQLLASKLKKIGVNAELAPSDWGGIVARRSNKGPISDGGWSIFISNYPNSWLDNPLTSPFLLANGEDAWFGWPKSEEYEALRLQWAEVENTEERQALASQMQRIWWDFVGAVFLGRAVVPVAYRKTLSGLVNTNDPLIVWWNMQKTSS